MPARTSKNGKPTVQTEAQQLHDLGFSVVPCNGKRAVVKVWNKKRLTRAELRDSLKGTKLNIAIALNHSELIDVEYDSPEAETALQAMFAGDVSKTPTWKSARGLHRLFRRPSGLPRKAKLELDGVEFRIGNGRGALSVVPPSKHLNGAQYEWLPGLSIHDIEPAELPPQIVARLQDAGASPVVEPSAEGSIPEGKRNDTLFAKACALKQLELPEETIATTLIDLNRRLCKPPLPEEEVRSIAHSAATGESKVSVGFLARLLGELELWHDENDDPFATLPLRDHRENWKIGKRSSAFRRWLSKRFYDATGEMIPDGDLSNIASLLEGKAVFDGPRYRLFRRIAEHAGIFYLDLCDEPWRAVEISEKGWKVVDDPPVKFRRAKAMHPLPLPVESDGPSLKRLLLPFLNIRDEQWPLVASWLIAALRPVGPYPALKLLGEQGSAKTTTARVLRGLVDPNAAPVRAEPRDTRDLMIAANNGWILCIDNISTIKPALSDALCRLSTGGGFATRTLYTDEDETIFDAQRPVILTSIEEIGTRSDLLERSLIIELPTIREEDRRPEKQFWAEFETVRPQILGALLDVVSGAIRRLPKIEQKQNADLPRMADFHIWGEAAEESLGLNPGVFAEAYTANREAATQIALESSPAVSALLRYLENNPSIEETATSLLEKLGLIDNCKWERAPSWPKTPRVLSAILKRVAPNLRQIGITAVQDTRGGGKSKEKIWCISVPSNPVPRKPSVKNAKPGCKGRRGSKISDKVSSSTVLDLPLVYVQWS